MLQDLAFIVRTAAPIAAASTDPIKMPMFPIADADPPLRNV
jgi:hypothetical protein